MAKVIVKLITLSVVLALSIGGCSKEEQSGESASSAMTDRLSKAGNAFIERMGRAAELSDEQREEIYSEYRQALTEMRGKDAEAKKAAALEIEKVIKSLNELKEANEKVPTYQAHIEKMVARLTGLMLRYRAPKSSEKIMERLSHAIDRFINRLSVQRTPDEWEKHYLAFRAEIQRIKINKLATADVEAVKKAGSYKLDVLVKELKAMRNIDDVREEDNTVWANFVDEKAQFLTGLAQRWRNSAAKLAKERKAAEKKAAKAAEEKAAKSKEDKEESKEENA